MKPTHIIGIVVVLVAVVLGVVAFAQTLTPYVTIAEARQSERPVQVHGYLQESLGYDAENHFRFVLVDDKGDTVTVVFERSLPANFEQAQGFVAIGRYDRRADLFRAEQLLVKCPSKYQEHGEGGPAETGP